eukprot:1992131-Prorocentrum_lima.AAC.1
MTGEVRVRASEEEVEFRIHPTLTNKLTTTPHGNTHVCHANCSRNGRCHKETVSKGCNRPRMSVGKKVP